MSALWSLAQYDSDDEDGENESAPVVDSGCHETRDGDDGADILSKRTTSSFNLPMPKVSLVVKRTTDAKRAKTLDTAAQSAPLSAASSKSSFSSVAIRAKPVVTGSGSALLSALPAPRTPATSSVISSASSSSSSSTFSSSSSKLLASLQSAPPSHSTSPPLPAPAPAPPPAPSSLFYTSVADMYNMSADSAVAYNYYEQAQYYQHTEYAQNLAIASVSAGATSGGGIDDPLERAIEMDRRRGSIRFVDVKQRELTAMSAAETANDSALAQANMDVKDVVVPTKRWDTSKGEATTVMAPSKLQKRKHQINTLAAQAKAATQGAAAMTLHAVSSKRATASKYGW